MGLKEKRIIQAFQKELFPALETEINTAAGFTVPLNISWNTLMEDRFSHLYNDTFPKIYFQPLIEAFKAICVDDMGIELLKAGLKEVVIVNENDEHNLDRAITFEEGVLKIDHSPVMNADNVDRRTARIIYLLEEKLEEFAEGTPEAATAETATSETENKQATTDEQENKVTIEELYNQSFVISTEKQEVFGEMVEGLGWTCDILEGKLTYGDDKVFDIQVLGTYSENEKSWLWAWGNTQSGIPEKFLQTALAAKTIGEAYQIEDFTTSKREFSSDPGVYFSTIISAMAKESCYVPLTFKGLTVYVTITSAEADSKARTAPALICSHFTKVAANYTFPHKYSLYFYLKGKGYEVELPGNNIVAKKGDDQILGIFDLKGRLMKISNSKITVKA
ncbi:hypothetical protein MPF19_11705 [Polaribacter sp. Z014]|uniref:DUF6882 domain-containing protein n=1 Tax=unclassified Polaribacter TaxID=196858 RepID=UPI00193C5AA7|nr:MULTISPECIES: DUF6882 domain-containing protein [unclassified Polaribacter]MCL7764085.1 hypothetical protein [Polaribacter sp. Z014]QVY65182.1 hypothetical protein JOP69_15735 [Polaribacter sp. Q13]